MNQYQYMSKSRYEAYRKSLAAAEASVVIQDHTCATVVSSRYAHVTYRIEIDATTLYSTRCDCEAKTADCVHRHAVDNALASERPSFYSTLASKELEEAMEKANEAIAADIEESESRLAEKIGDFYEQRAKQIVYGTCGHISNRDDDECSACRSKAWR